jgi:hypothetical protein
MRWRPGRLDLVPAADIEEWGASYGEARLDQAIEYVTHDQHRTTFSIAFAGQAARLIVDPGASRAAAGSWTAVPQASVKAKRAPRQKSAKR